MYKYERGNMSEGIVLCAYLNEGFTVSIPFGAGASYDLVVDADSCLLKIQVKTAWISEGCVLYKSHGDSLALVSHAEHTEKERLITL